MIIHAEIGIQGTLNGMVYHIQLVLTDLIGEVHESPKRPVTETLTR